MKFDEFVQNWIQSWNSHDLNDILSHYSNDFTISSPLIEKVIGTGDKLKGKMQIGEYWKKALEKYPDLQFQLIAYATGTKSIAIFYNSIGGKKCIEFMQFDDKWLVTSVVAHYS